MMARRVVVEGTGRVRRRLELLTQEVVAAVRREVKRTALDIQGRARRNLNRASRGKGRRTSDTGRLANSIAIAEEQDGLDARIGTNLIYARAIEFGFPPGYLQRMPPVDAIQGWVRRKLGVKDAKEARSIAFAIARKIKRSGTKAQPFLFPAAEAAKRGFRTRLRKAVREALKRATRSA